MAYQRSPKIFLKSVNTLPSVERDFAGTIKLQDFEMVGLFWIIWLRGSKVREGDRTTKRCGTASQGMWAAFRRWNRQRSGSRRNAAWPIHFRLVTTRTVR
jgi:hypothetical protein